MTPSDRWLLSLNLAHIGGVSILFRCLYSAATVVIPPSGLRTEELAERVSAEGITLLSVVPTQLKRLLELSRLPAMPRLRAILVGGARCPAHLLEQARRRGLPALATYGLSEAASQVTTQPLTDRRSLHSIGDSGLPLPPTEIRIADGVLEVRGPTLFDGYLVPGRPNERTLPLTPDGFFSTGDWGSITPDGRFVALGRHTDRIVTGGENVSPVEVEDALLRLPDVDEAAVVGLSDPEWGQVVASAIVRKGGASKEDSSKWVEGIATKLRQSLAPFKCPKRWCVVRELPRLPSGKLDRRGVLKFFD
jgi:O-succinylbenzoic acid--CoA ligase